MSFSKSQVADSVTPTATLIDFTKTPLEPYYSSPRPFALVIDDLFTREECEALLSLAQSDNSEWEVALVNSGGGHQQLAKNIRDCTRIMIDDFDTAGWIYERVKPYLEEVEVVGGGSKKWRFVGDYRTSARSSASWKMTR